MSALLTDPTTALVVSDSGQRVDEVAAALRGGLVTDVESVPSAALARDRLTDTADVGCVVLTDEVTNATVMEAAWTIRDFDDLLPVVAYVEDADLELARSVSTIGHARFVPADSPPETVRTIVEDAMDEYETERRHAEESSILSSLLEDVGVSIFAKDEKGRHVRASKVPGGYSPEQLRGKTDLDVYADEDPEMARKAYEDDLQVIREEQPIYERDEVFDDESGEYWARTTKIPWRGEDDEVKGLVGLSYGITDHVKRERKLERQEERIEKFARYVTHDLRNPLQVATGAIDLARETGDTESLDQAADALERIDSILDDLSSLAKEETDSVTFDVEEPSEQDFASGVRIVDLVEEVWDVVQTDEASLAVEFSEGAIVNAPETSVRPILENLFKNAIDHGGEDVTIRVGPLDDGGFYVEDDGPGIPEEMRDKVLDEGFTTSEDGSGTGLGIVSETTDKHEWDLAIAESPSGGTRIEIANCLVVPHPDQWLSTGESLELRSGTDVGDVEIEGGADYDDATDEWTLSGAGANIWRQENDFHFVYVPVEGPVRIEARIVEIEEMSEYSKAGVMIRDDLEKDASYGYIGVTPRHGTEILWRRERGDDGISQHLEEESLTYPWYRVDRADGVITSWLSADGEDWYPIDQRSVAMDEEVCVGLVVCSFTPRRLCEATFADVSVNRLVRD